jgi:hypothetical protein
MFLSLPPQAALKMALRGCGFPGEMNKKKSFCSLFASVMKSHLKKKAETRQRVGILKEKRNLE